MRGRRRTDRSEGQEEDSRSTVQLGVTPCSAVSFIISKVTLVPLPQSAINIWDWELVLVPE